jgi:hypothetical protein
MAFAIQVIPEARYRLGRDIRGIGFKIADGSGVKDAPSNRPGSRAAIKIAAGRQVDRCPAAKRHHHRLRKVNHDLVPRIAEARMGID